MAGRGVRVCNAGIVVDKHLLGSEDPSVAQELVGTCLALSRALVLACMRVRGCARMCMGVLPDLHLYPQEHERAALFLLFFGSWQFAEQQSAQRRRTPAGAPHPAFGDASVQAWVRLGHGSPHPPQGVFELRVPLTRGLIWP